jgi:para-nitrobenzyl esterase
MGVTVKTTDGLVAGIDAAHATHAFLGIPFAAAPIGALRFAPPSRPGSWDGTRDCSRFGDVVPQASAPGAFGDLFNPVNPQGPDCLNLNVWTPDPGAAGLPVLVWIHGGAFVIGAGSDSIYDGATFARDGVVTVTINYRLGAAGFHHVGDGVPGSGAFGVLDMVAALEWVQENIEAFGGDPSRVTIAGESAGGMSVGTLLGTPAAAGLFRRAIPQSGAGHHSMSTAGASLIAAALAEELGCDPRDAPEEQLLAAQSAVSAQIQLTRDAGKYGVEATSSMMGWLPMAGGDVLPERPIDAVRAGSAKDVDVLVGTCRDEYMLFLGVDPTVLGIDASMVRPAFDMTFGAGGADAFATYERNRPGAPAAELLSALLTDQMFRIPAVRLADAQAGAGGRVFSYLFSWESPAFDGRIKAGHALELPFTWDNVHDRMATGLVGAEPPQALADEMHGAWVRFITEGDPGWAPYDSTTRTTRQFGAAPELIEDHAGDERALWDGVL